MHVWDRILLFFPQSENREGMGLEVTTSGPLAAEAFLQAMGKVTFAFWLLDPKLRFSSHQASSNRCGWLLWLIQGSH